MAQVKAMFESALSMLISYIKAERPGVDVGRDDREILGKILEDVAEGYKADESAWPLVRHMYFYDVYLEARREDGTITHYDLVRPGLNKMQFSDEKEYLAHMVRISEERWRGDGDSKKCSSCGYVKPALSFRKGGGAKCNSCRSKEYRDRKKDDINQGGQ